MKPCTPIRPAAPVAVRRASLQVAFAAAALAAACGSGAGGGVGDGAGGGGEDGAAVPQRIAVGGRRHLLLEADRIELLKGSARRTRPSVYVNHAYENRERLELAVPLLRGGALLWRVDAPPGSAFSTDVARLVAGEGADASSCVVRVTAVDEGGNEVFGAGGEPVATAVRVPAFPAGHSSVPGPWREGPAARLELPLPDGAHALRLRIVAGDDAPPDGAVALLSPVLDEPRRELPWDETPLRFAGEQRLLGQLTPCDPSQRVVFAMRRDEAGERPVLVCRQAPVASFTGHEARPALALLAGETASFTVDVEAGSVLRCAVAVDQRMPADARGRLVARIDGAPLGEVDFGHVWREVALPLGAHAGAARRLELSVTAEAWQPEWTLRTFVDRSTYLPVQAEVRAEVLRAGIADPVVETPRARPRRASSPARPNVVVVHIETLRADALPPWGAEVPGLTPHLDALAERSVLFDTAISPSSWTLPSTATLLTGLLPSAHGVVNTGRALVPPDRPTLAELARDAGVVTAGIVSNNLLTLQGGYGRGFTTFAEPHHANAGQVLHLAEAHLRRHAGQQSLLWLHLMDPHFPYMAPGGWRDRYVTPAAGGGGAVADGGALPAIADQDAVARLKEALRAGADVPPDAPDVRLCVERYRGEIAYLDAQLGAFLDELERLGLADETAIVVTADHGEEFFEHGMLGHGTELFDETVHVPLLVFDPAGRLGPPRRVGGVVSTAGLFATVLELLEVPYEREGVRPSLLPARPEPFAFTETSQGLAPGGGELLSRLVTAVRTDDALLVWRHAVADGERTEELYDLVADPGARHPLPPEGDLHERLSRMMEASLEWSAARREPSPVTGVDVEWLDALRRIGYVDGD